MSAAEPAAVVRSRAWWPWAGLVLFGFGLATITRADPDLWGHLRFGLDTLSAHRLSSVDPYSFTQDRPWINHEWLSEVIMAVAYRAAGSAGLALLKATLIAAVFGTVWISLRGAHAGARLAAMAWLILGVVHMTSSIRPQLWSFLCMALLCRAFIQHPRARPFWLVAMFTLWANLHGGWFVGLGVLFLWEAVSLRDEGSPARSALLVAACALATLCTPYGWRLWQFAWQTIRPERAILEWRPLWESDSVLGWVIWAGTTILVAWVGRRPDRNRLARWMVLGILAFGALRVMRVGSLYIVSALILLSPVLPAARSTRQRSAPARRSPWEPLVIAIPFLLSIVAFARVTAVSLSCLPSTGPWAADGEAITVLASAPPGRLVTYFDWGEYAIWHVGPRIRVSMDGRRETIYSDSLLARHDEVVSGTPAGLATLAEWAPEYVWLPQTSADTKRWLLDHDYQIAVETPRSFVVSRTALPSPRVFPALPDSAAATRCFPN